MVINRDPSSLLGEAPCSCERSRICEKKSAKCGARPATRRESMRRLIWSMRRPALTTLVARIAACAATASAAAATAAAACKAADPPAASKRKSEAAPKSLHELVLGLSARSRHVFLCGNIDDEVAKSVIAQLVFLEQESPGTPIKLLINSPGGKVQAGLAIHDVIQVSHGSPSPNLPAQVH